MVVFLQTPTSLVLNSINSHLSKENCSFFSKSEFTPLVYLSSINPKQHSPPLFPLGSSQEELLPLSILVLYIIYTDLQSSLPESERSVHPLSTRARAAEMAVIISKFTEQNSTSNSSFISNSFLLSHN